MYIMLMKYNLFRHAWLHVLRRKPDAADAVRKFLALLRVAGVPSKVDIVRSDNGGRILYEAVWRGLQTVLHQKGIHQR